MKRWALILSFSAMAFCFPAAAQTPQQDYEAGVAARHAGRAEEALALFERAVRAEPGNADIHLQIGFAQLAIGRLDKAAAAFHRTLHLAPGYGDARLGLAQVAYRRGDLPGATAELDRISGQSSEADQLRRQIAVARTAGGWRWRSDLDGGYSRVENLTDWRAMALTIQHRPNERVTLAFTTEATRRFGLTDNYGEARVDYGIAPGRSFYVLAGGTPGADYRPRWQVGLGATVRVRGGPHTTALRLDMRQADYPSGDVQTLSLGAEQHVAGRGWLTANWINVWDNSAYSSGWLVRGDVMASDRIRLFAGAANAPDLDAGEVIRTRSLFVGLEMDLGDHLTLRTSLSHDDPEGPNDRNTLALGMGYRF